MSSPTPAADESKWGYRRSLASRVVVLTTLAVGLAVVFMAAGAYVVVRMQLQSSLDTSLVDRAETSASQLDRIYNEDAPAFLLGASDVRIGFVDSAGRTSYVGRDAEMPVGDAEIAVARGEADHSLRTVVADGEDFRVVAVPIQANAALVVGQSLEPQHQTLARLGLVCLLIGLVGVALAGVAGTTVARNGLRPVRRLTTDVERIARTQDLTPLPVEGDDEVARLATAFNQMLTSLAASRDRQRRLVADAGHELRTPLTSLRTNIDLLVQAGASLPEEARGELLGDVRAQLEELSTLVGDLVELSRDEPGAQGAETVEVHECLENALTRVRRRAPGITFEATAEPWLIEGEPAVIERAITNLLDNAAKWSPPEGVVHVALANGILTVDDDGPGIADADLPHVFERFYRSSESRSMPGSGLGLAIVSHAAERHGGSVSAGRSPTGGARLTLTLPGR